MDVRRVLAPTDDIGESPLLPAAALFTAAALYADLPRRFIAGPSAGAFGVVRWVVPTLTVLVLLTFVAIRPLGPLARALGWRTQPLHLTRRRLALTTIAIVSAANCASIILLVHLLVNDPRHVHAAPLLRAAVHMWVVNVLLFGLWYWQLDGGGPLNRRTCAPHERDFLFPQHTEPALEVAGWRPLFPRLPLPLFHERGCVQPDRHDAAQPLGQDADARPVGDQPRARRDGRGAGRQHPALARGGVASQPQLPWWRL